jgi:hypothetical protein
VPVIAPAGGPIGPKKEGGRPEGTTDIPIIDGTYSRADIQTIVYEIDGLVDEAKAKMLKKLDTKELSEAQQDMISNLCESIVCSQSKEYWGETLESCVKDFNEIEALQTLKEVLDISAEHSLEVYPAAILYHSHEKT